MKSRYVTEVDKCMCTEQELRHLKQHCCNSVSFCKLLLLIGTELIRSSLGTKTPSHAAFMLKQETVVDLTALQMLLQ
jgi:hypothetical protein